MTTIWGRLSSVNVQKVVWCADELGLDYQRIDAGGKFGVNDTPEYLAKNPNGLVPVLEEDGFVLYESNAIVRYLVARDPEARFWPKDLRQRADVDRWMEWQSSNYTPAMTAIFWQLVRTAPEKREPALIEASRAKCEKLTAVLDAHLAQREWLAGERFSAADIVVGCAAHRWLNLPVERTARPAVERWYRRLQARPASRQVTTLALS
jgi:glutathione S-transferase